MNTPVHDHVLTFAHEIASAIGVRVQSIVPVEGYQSRWEITLTCTAAELASYNPQVELQIGDDALPITFPMSIDEEIMNADSIASLADAIRKYMVDAWHTYSTDLKR